MERPGSQVSLGTSWGPGNVPERDGAPGLLPGEWRGKTASGGLLTPQYGSAPRLDVGKQATDSQTTTLFRQDRLPPLLWKPVYPGKASMENWRTNASLLLSSPIPTFQGTPELNGRAVWPGRKGKSSIRMGAGFLVSEKVSVPVTEEDTSVTGPARVS